MEKKTAIIEPLLARLEEYAVIRCELFKLKALDKSAYMISILAANIFTAFVFILFLIMANIGVALWLGEWLGKTYYGYFCVAGFYGVLCLVLYFGISHQIQKNSRDYILDRLID